MRYRVFRKRRRAPARASMRMARRVIAVAAGVVIGGGCWQEAAAQESRSPSMAPPVQTEGRARAAPGLTSYPAEAGGDGAMTGHYAPARWAEDWRRMRDPAARDDPLDRLKYLPITGDHTVYLTLSGEARARVNLTTNPGLLDAAAQRQDIYRLFAGADLHLGDHVRVYGELARGAIAGENIGTPPTSLRNALLVQQLFADWKGDVAGAAAGIRVGRQEFVDGPNLLLANRDNNTLHFTLNGVRAWARARTIRADIFDFRYTLLGAGGIADDPVDGSRRFTGITTGIVVPRGLFGGSRLYFDPFAWRLRNRAMNWAGRVAREERFYAGVHLWGDVGRATVDWTINHQSGTFDQQSIDAWQLFFAQTYRLGRSNRAARLGFHADYATGGGAVSGGKLRSAFAPFGNNIYYSYGLFLTPTNLIAIAPNLTIAPMAKVRVTGEYQWAWRANTAEPVYRANGTAYANTASSPYSKTANVARLQIIYAATPRLSFTLRLEHFDSAGGLRAAGYRDSSFAGSWINFRF